MDERLVGALVTGVSSLVVAILGYITAHNKNGGTHPRRPLTPGAVQQVLWATVAAVMLALVVAEALAPLWHDSIVFPLQAYPFLISALVYWLYLSLSGKNDNDGGKG